MQVSTCQVGCNNGYNLILLIGETMVNPIISLIVGETMHGCHMYTFDFGATMVTRFVLLVTSWLIPHHIFDAICTFDIWCNHGYHLPNWFWCNHIDLCATMVAIYLWSLMQPWMTMQRRLDIASHSNVACSLAPRPRFFSIVRISYGFSWKWSYIQQRKLLTLKMIIYNHA